MDPVTIISVWENKDVRPPWQLIHMENGRKCFEVGVLVGLETAMVKCVEMFCSIFVCVIHYMCISIFFFFFFQDG